MVLIHWHRFLLLPFIAIFHFFFLFLFLFFSPCDFSCDDPPFAFKDITMLFILLLRHFSPVYHKSFLFVLPQTVLPRWLSIHAIPCHALSPPSLSRINASRAETRTRNRGLLSLQSVAGDWPTGASRGKLAWGSERQRGI